jgi:hypothetical protein
VGTAWVWWCDCSECLPATFFLFAINSARTLTNILSNPFSLCFFNSENLVGKEKEAIFAALV